MMVQGKRLWVHKLPAPITLVEMLDYKTQGAKGVIVALRNKEVRLYRGKYLINLLQVDVSPKDIVPGPCTPPLQSSPISPSMRKETPSSLTPSCLIWLTLFCFEPPLVYLTQSDSLLVWHWNYVYVAENEH